LVMVSAGPLEICHVFLGNFQNYPSSQVSEMKNAILQLLNACQESLALHRELTQSTSGSWRLYHELQAGYVSMRASMKQFVDAVTFAQEHQDTCESTTNDSDDDTDDRSERSKTPKAIGDWTLASPALKKKHRHKKDKDKDKDKDKSRRRGFLGGDDTNTASSSSMDEGDDE